MRLQGNVRLITSDFYHPFLHTISLLQILTLLNNALAKYELYLHGTCIKLSILPRTAYETKQKKHVHAMEEGEQELQGSAHSFGCIKLVLKLIHFLTLLFQFMFTLVQQLCCITF
jgi:hypothetical protein